MNDAQQKTDAEQKTGTKCDWAVGKDLNGQEWGDWEAVVKA